MWCGVSFAAPTYEQQVAAIRAEHANVVAKECTPKKRPDVAVCKREANETLSRALRDLRTQHEQQAKRATQTKGSGEKK
jgi:hypothetical protein